MPKSPNQKLKILYLLKMLWEDSDENHPLTVAHIAGNLQKAGVSVERKTVYDDLETLKTFGIDIITVKGRNNRYFIGERIFELAELKLLVDAVQYSKSITLKKSNELIKKLESQISRHEAGQLHRQVHVVGRVKTMNESIYYNVDALHQAIALGKKVGFRYFEYTVDKKKRFRYDGEEYAVCPIMPAWCDDNYYLVAYHERYKAISHFRVDKMEKIRVLDEDIDCPVNVKEFDMAGYAKKMFGMFSGEPQEVTIQFDNSLAGVVIDRFGKDAQTEKTGESHFTAKLLVAVSPAFLSWVFKFGTKAKILSPRAVIEQMIEITDEVKNQYINHE